MADDPDFSPVLRRNAQWADTFGGSSTNLAQRQRYAQDKEMYAQDLLQQQEAQAENLARTDRVAQDFYFRQKDLGRKMEMDKFTRGLRDREQERKDSMLPLQMDTEKARADANDSLTVTRLRKEARDAKQAKRVADDVDAFETKVHDMLDLGILPGSQEFATGMLEATASHPYIPGDLRKSWMGQAGVDIEPEEYMRQTAQFRDKNNLEARLTSKPNGRFGVTLTERIPKSAVDTALKDDAQRIRHLENLLSRKIVDPDVKSYLSSELAKVKSGGQTKPSGRPEAAQEIASPRPINEGAAKWLQDNPDDPRAPAIRAKLGM